MINVPTKKYYRVWFINDNGIKDSQVFYIESIPKLRAHFKKMHRRNIINIFLAKEYNNR
jgi:hypothetical protein